MNLVRRSLVVLFCLSLSAPTWSAAQSSAVPSSPADHPTQPQADSRMVLDVTVVDRSGHPVTGLQQQDFTVLDNKVSTSITGFQALAPSSSATAAPQPDPQGQIIFLLDEVNTNFSHNTRARDQLMQFLRQVHGPMPQPASIAILSDAGIRLQGQPLSDANQLISVIDANNHGLRTVSRAAGFYGATERLQLSLRALSLLAAQEMKVPGHKTVIWLSPGWPLLSGPGVDLTPKTEESLFHSLVDLSEQLRLARITLDSVDPLGTDDSGGLRAVFYENFLKPVASPRQIQAGDLALQVFAVHSGGRVLVGSNDVAGEIAACVADAQADYVVSFAPGNNDPPSAFHAVQVKVDRPGVTVRTKVGYYTQP
jgi:VWFA-related protein